MKTHGSDYLVFKDNYFFQINLNFEILKKAASFRKAGEDSINAGYGMKGAIKIGFL